MHVEQSATTRSHLTVLLAVILCGPWSHTAGKSPEATQDRPTPDIGLAEVSLGWSPPNDGHGIKLRQDGLPTSMRGSEHPKVRDARRTIAFPIRADT